MRFFELFIENKNLLKQGLYLLEICQNAAGSTDLATGCNGHDEPSWTPSSHTWCNFFWYSLHYPRRKVWRIVTGTTVRRGSPFQNTWTHGIWVLGLLLCLREEPAGRTVILSVTPHLVRLPHLPSASALRCHLRTITSMMDHHKLRRWYFSAFLTKKHPHLSLDRFSANKEKLT